MNRDIGCRQLSIQRGGMRCFAYSQSNFPCIHAAAGCTNHVANSGGPLEAWRVGVGSERVRCMFGPAMISKLCMSARCPNPRSSPNVELCFACSVMNVPCVMVTCTWRGTFATRPCCQYCPRDAMLHGPPPQEEPPAANCETNRCFAIVYGGRRCVDLFAWLCPMLTRKLFAPSFHNACCMLRDLHGEIGNGCSAAC